MSVCRQHVVPKRLDVLPQLGQSFLTHLVVPACSVTLVRDEPGLRKNSQVLRHGGLRHPRCFSEFTNSAWTAPKPFVQAPAGWIGKGDENFSISHALY
jgi:hypothetical protein